jgi:hypothetical protein
MGIADVSKEPATYIFGVVMSPTPLQNGNNKRIFTKHCYLSTKLYGDASQKTLIIILISPLNISMFKYSIQMDRAGCTHGGHNTAKPAYNRTARDIE